MHSSNGELLLIEFQRALIDCRELYLASGQMVVQQYPNLVEDADRHLTVRERSLANALVQHIWRKQLTDDQLNETLMHLSAHAAKLQWYSLLRPFDRIAPLREKIASLETVITRVANIVAKADGVPTINEPVAKFAASTWDVASNARVAIKILKPRLAPMLSRSQSGG